MVQNIIWVKIWKIRNRYESNLDLSQKVQFMFYQNFIKEYRERRKLVQKEIMIVNFLLLIMDLNIDLGKIVKIYVDRNKNELYI